MTRQSYSFLSPWSFATVALVFACFASVTHAQVYLDVLRGDEVGLRDFEVDEETFMNVLSYEQPFENKEEWFVADSGYRVAFGSIDEDVLWLEHELKHRVEFAGLFSVRAFVRQASDLDSDHLFFQIMPEIRVHENFDIVLPISLSSNKGLMDGGAGLRFRPGGDQFVQATVTRSDLLFDQRSSGSSADRVEEPSYAFEVQGQLDLIPCGKTSFKVVRLTPSEYHLLADGESEEYERISGWLLQSLRINEQTRAFVEANFHQVDESVSLLPQSVADPFSADRDLKRILVEVQREFETEKGESHRWRVGAGGLWFDEDQFLGGAMPVHTSMTRKELLSYVGYLFPFNDSGSVHFEPMLYTSLQSIRNRDAIRPPTAENHQGLQAKIALNIEYSPNENVHLTVQPSFELDDLGWGGGGLRLRWRF